MSRAGTKPLDLGVKSAVNEELFSFSDTEASVSEKTVTSVEGSKMHIAMKTLQPVAMKIYSKRVFQ